ncbi:HutD family protein [Murdochiella vaginalis]|uniref:HutD/Ves family protein n=1 Tax=Murdochiella vaginalis TaxID=1852373 RepID=UPI0008FE7274|nr:HutD family protein [Murdochiella vaginalis]
MEYQIITPDQFQVSTWAGGTTTQLYIDPAGEDFKKRMFAVRLSSATFTDTSSTFSEFTGYNRMIFPLVGHLSVDHSCKGEALYERMLAPYEIENFSGSWTTDSTNSADCVDFNLITREGLSSHTEVLREERRLSPHEDGTILLYSRSAFSVCAQEGKPSQETTISVDAGCLLVITASPKLAILNVKPGKEPVVVGEVCGQ